MNKKIAPEDIKAWRKFTSSKETIENKDYYLDQKKASTQKIRKVLVDCDSDALIYLVEPAGPACHTGERTCFHNSLKVK